MAGCSHCPTGDRFDRRYRRVLVAVLTINAVMFGVEVTGGLISESVALQADALDFLGDAATYAMTLLVLGFGPVWRSRAGLVKGGAMAVFGVYVMAATVHGVFRPGEPVALAMGGIGGVALAANLLSAFLLYRYRRGDANMRSAWLCTRNDVLSNVAVIAAGTAVWGSGTPWPDLLVGAVIAGLALSASVSVIAQARLELRIAAGAD